MPDTLLVTPRNDTNNVIRRKLGKGELSYFLPSRADGVNDMYLHLGFNAPGHLISQANILTLWTLLRIRHPLLASVVEFIDYDNVEFVYDIPKSPLHAIRSAMDSLSFVHSSKDDLVSSYLNGPRTLASNHLSHLFFSYQKVPIPTSAQPDYRAGNVQSNGFSCDASIRECDILIATTHYLGDGMALHNFANDFFLLLTSEGTQPGLLIKLLENEWHDRCSEGSDGCRLPLNLELKLETLETKWKQTIAKAEFQSTQRKLIGGHSFPRSSKPAARHTIVPTVSFSPERTTAILKKCKQRGVSISNAIFSLCGLAWSEIAVERQEIFKPGLPLMMYSALNMRPFIKPTFGLSTEGRRDSDSYWFLAVGYFNVILPSFLPSEVAGLDEDSETGRVSAFWNRAHSARRQSNAAAKSKFVVTRSHAMSDERAERAIQWAREDDQKAAGVWLPTTTTDQKQAAGESNKSVPSQALIGLSLLGNLDGIYKHSVYSKAQISLHTLTTGSRQRSGAMLLFGYTFAGRLWLSLGYDENGFDKDVVELFWDRLIKGVGEFLG